jgi:hypothetical protein
MKGQWKVNLIGTVFCWGITAVLTLVGVADTVAYWARLFEKKGEG